MERIIVNSNLEEFQGLDCITDVNEETVSGEKSFKNAPFYLGMEAMAQLCALHVRKRCDFERHAFLLSIKKGEFSAPHLEGRYVLRGKRVGRSQNAFVYQVTGSVDGRDDIMAELLIGTCPYNEAFNGDTLREHYQKVFICLYQKSNPA
jgi:hypothetical protein